MLINCSPLIDQLAKMQIWGKESEDSCSKKEGILNAEGIWSWLDKEGRNGPLASETELSNINI